MLQRLHSVLKPGGRCVIDVRRWRRRRGVAKEGVHHGTYWHYFRPDELRTCLEDAGFRDIRLFGAAVLPGSIAVRLPPQAAFIETVLTRIPALSGSGALVVATGRR